MRRDYAWIVVHPMLNAASITAGRNGRAISYAHLITYRFGFPGHQEAIARCSDGSSWPARGGRISVSTPIVHPRLLRAFCATEYRAAGATARIGRRSAAVDQLLCTLGAHNGAFLTAWNPGARRWPLGKNLRMDRALRGWLRRNRAEPGVGSAPGWQEAHWLMATDPRRVVVLARRFRQAAIVVVRCGQKAKLRFLSAGAGRSGAKPWTPS